MVNAEQLEMLAIGETVNVDGYKVTVSTQKNGKRIYLHEGFSSRSAKQVLSYIAWAKKEDKKFGVKR